MIEHRDGTSTPLIDASVHIFFGSTPELRTVMRSRSRAAGSRTTRWTGTAPPAAVRQGSRGPDGQYPGSDPDVVARHLFTDRGVDVAVLHPMGRGIMPDRHLGTAILAAHNEMMVSRWLEHPELGERFRGTIRVNPDDISGALREIDKLQEPPARRADRHPAAVPRALRQAAVLGAVGGRRGCRASGGHPHRGRRGHRVPADAVETPDLQAVPGLHVAELHLSPAEHDRRGRFRAAARPEVRLGRRRRGHGDPVHLADGLLRPSAPGADAVGAEDASDYLPGTSSSSTTASTAPATPTSPTSGCRSPARTTC